MSRAVGLNAARDAGLGLAESPPVGTWAGRLIAKAWGKQVNILCYFEHCETGTLHRCVAYKSRKSAIYSSRDEVIDFSEEGIEGNLYQLETAINRNGNPSWLKATLLANPDSKDLSGASTPAPF